MKENHVLNKSVGIWIRVSTEDQANGDSPEHHQERARSYAKSKGWQVKEVYNLAGQSGKAVMQHPEAKRMMKDIERGHITGLVFSKLARLSRNRRELEDFSDFFNKHQADLVSLSEAVDTSTAGGRMFFHLLGVFAQWEREEIAERVNASVLTRAKLGKSINGSAPYGYHWHDRKLVVQPEEAAVRRKAYELFAKLRRKGQVAQQLNAAGYRTGQGNLWSDTAILRILDDSSAKGVYVFNTMRKTGTWRTELKPEEEWGRLECEPIVSEELWNSVNQIIQEQLKAWKKPGKAPVHLFSGLAYCSCEQGKHKMYVSNQTLKYFCRKCCNKIPAEKLENVARNQLQKYFGQPERIAEHLQEAGRNLAEKSALLDTHRREIQKVKDEMRQTHQLYLDRQISGEGFRDLFTPAEERKKQLEAELPKLEADVDFLKVNQLSAEDVLGESLPLYERWPNLPPGEKRQIVEALIEKVVIGDGRIDISYSGVPSSVDSCKNLQRLSNGRGEGQGEVRVYGEVGSREIPEALGAAMKVVARRLAFPLFLLLLLSAVSVGAQTNEVSSDPVVQGRQLAQKILDQTPPANSTVTGILQIRDKNGARTSIPIACAIIAAGSSWECVYQASWTNHAEILRIRHSATGANRYLMETSQTALSPDQLTTAPTSAPGENPLSNAEITNSFAGSEFCLADLGLEFFHWPEQKVLKPEIHRSRGCTILESTNPNSAAGGYLRVDSWIDNETLGIVEAYAYDANGRKLKDFYPKDFKKVGGRWQVQTLVIENLQTDARSRLEFDLKK